MEQYNLSWTLWMQKMVLGKAWRHLRAATMNNHGCLRSSVCMCTHAVHAWFQIKYVTRNKSYAKGKAWSWRRHDSFILNPKLGWSLADGHKHSDQSTEVSTNVVMEDLPVVSTRPSHSLCSQGVPICLSLIGAYQNYVLCRLICMPINIGSTAKLRNKLLKRQRWVWRRFLVDAGTRLLTSVTCS